MFHCLLSKYKINGVHNMTFMSQQPVTSEMPATEMSQKRKVSQVYLNFKILSFGIVYKESEVFLPYWFIGLVSNLKLEKKIIGSRQIIKKLSNKACVKRTSFFFYLCKIHNATFKAHLVQLPSEEQGHLQLNQEPYPA